MLLIQFNYSYLFKLILTWDWHLNLISFIILFIRDFLSRVSEMSRQVKGYDFSSVFIRTWKIEFGFIISMIAFLNLSLIKFWLII